MASPDVVVRDARPTDTAFLVGLIRELAAYENLESEVRADEGQLAEHLFGARPVAQALVGCVDGRPAGYALYFTTYSTFLTKPGYFLEDLIVTATDRGRGVGKALLVELARRTVAAGYGRLEWSVLDWNAPAIAFYRSLGAVPLEDWTGYRLTGDALDRTGS